VLVWSSLLEWRGIAKYQIPSTKLQINLKSQYSMTKTGLGFGILVIVICLLFVICDLEFQRPLFSKTARITYSHRGTEKKVLWIALTALCRSLVLTRK